MDDIIKRYHFKEGLNHEFEILDLEEILSRKKEMMTVAHRAQFYHILWIEKGSGTHYVDFSPVEVQDNTVIFVSQNSVNKYDLNCNYHGKCIIFTNTFFCKNHHDLQYLNTSMLFSDLYQTARFKISMQAAGLKALVNAIETEFVKEPDNAQSMILHNLLHVFLLISEREMRKQGFKELAPSANLDYVVLFKDLLEQNFRQEKSVHYYASELSLSDKQLNKACSALLDKTPKQIIDERVVLEAKRLLVHSNQAIKEIAYELGYDEPTNFIKYFRKHANATPSEFRENN